MKPYLAQSKTEIKLALSQGESLLVTIGIPVIVLIGLSLTKALPLPATAKSATNFLVPGTMTLAIMATGSELKILDLERAAKISGSMFPMFRGQEDPCNSREIG